MNQINIQNFKILDCETLDNKLRLLENIYINKLKPFLNSFASQHLVFEEKIEPFLLENGSNQTHDFLYDNFNKKI